MGNPAGISHKKTTGAVGKKPRRPGGFLTGLASLEIGVRFEVGETQMMGKVVLDVVGCFFCSPAFNPPRIPDTYPTWESSVPIIDSKVPGKVGDM